MRNSSNKIIRLNTIIEFLIKETGSIHDLLEYVNLKLIDNGGQIVRIRTIQKDIQALKESHNLEIMRYLPDPNQIVTKYGNEGLKQYSHENKPIDLTKVYFLQLTSGSVSKNLSKDEQITLTEAALVLSRFQGNSGFEMIDDVIDSLNDCSNLVGLSLQNKIANEQNNAYRKNEFLKIKEALLSEKVIDITLKNKFSKKKKTIEFHPHYLKMWNNKWYAYGYSKDDSYHPYTLPVDLLIENVVFKNAKFIKSTINYYSDDNSTFFDDIIGVTNDLNLPVEKIILKITNKDRYIRIKHNPLHFSCEFDDNKYLITMDVKINNELINSIMTHIDDIVVVSPKKLRSKLIEKINKLDASYKTN